MNPRRIFSTARLSFPLASAIVASLLAAQSAQAANGNWNVDNSGNWGTASNWSSNPTVPGTAAGDVIGLTFNITAARTVTINAANVTMGTLNIGDSNSTHAYTLARTGSNLLILDNGGSPAAINKTGTIADTISAPIQLNSNLAANATGQITLSGGITESGGTKNLIKSGAGALVLNGVSNYTGTTEVSAGTLRFVTQASLYNNTEASWTAANINVKSGATLAFNVGGAAQFTDANITTLLTNLAASSSLTNGMNAGSNFAFNTDTTPNFFTLTGLIADSTGASGGARGFQKLGIGTLVLTNANTYTGATTISGGTLRLENTTASSSITLGSGTILQVATDAAYAGPRIVSTAGTIVSDRATAGAGLTHAFSGVTRLGTGNTNITAGANVTSGTAAIQFASLDNDNGTIANFGLNPTTANVIVTGGVKMGDINTGTANFTLGGTGSVNSIAGALINGTRATGNLIKSGSSTWTLSGANTYNGTTAVNGGLLILDYSSQNNSKLADGAALTLGNATLQLSGGSHLETVSATTLTAGTSSRVTSSGSSVLQMNAIARSAGATIDFSAPGIATTDSANVNGILGTWATIAGTDFARNSTGLDDGPITAAAYTDVTRLDSGPQVVADGAGTNVRIIEGTGTAANITLGAATTTINTLNQSISGGTGSATIDSGGQTLRTNAILAGPTAGLLTIGTGTLTTATAGGELSLSSNSAGGITINSIIADNTTASSLIKQGTGLVTLGTANTYTGATTVNQGTLTVGPTGSLGSTTAALAVNNDNSSGAGTNTILNLTSGGNTTVGNLTSAITPLVSGMNTVTINTGGTGLDFTINQTAALNYAGVIGGAGNFIYNGSATNSLTLSGANTYTGSTSIGAGGLLILSHVNALGGATPGVNATSGIIMAAGSRFVPTLTGVVINAPITVGATGTTVTLNAPNVATQTFTDGVLTLGGAIGGAGNVTFNSSQNVNNLNNVLLTAQSTYAGTTLMDTTGGTAAQIVVRLGIDNALPATTVLTIDGQTGAGTGRVAEFVMNGYNQTLAGLSNVTRSLRVQRVVNSDVSAASTLTINGSGDSTYGGAIGVNSAGNSMGAANFPGGTNGNNILLAKNGSGTFALTAANTFSGKTTVFGGVLSLGNASALSQSPLDTQNSITGTPTAGLRTTVTTLTLGGLTGNKDFANVFETATGGYTGLTALTLNPVSGATHTYSGNVGNGAGAMTLTKTGAGTQTLSGTNTWTGTTVVSAGTLIINGDHSGATGAITVAAGATLGGTGTLGGALTVNGTFAPGTSPGTMTTSGPVIFNAGSVLNYELVGNDFTVGGGVNDLLTGLSDLTLGGTLNVTEVGVGSFAGAVEGNTWRLMNYTGTLAGGLTLGTTPALSGGRSFALNAGGGQVNLVVVPEPTTTVTLLAGLGLLLGRRRRA